MRRTWTILAALGALLAVAPAAQAAEFAVTSTADVAGACTVEQCTIRQALGSAAAAPGEDLVTIPPGTYTLTLGALAVDSAVTLRGSGTRGTTITAGATPSRVLDIGAFAVRVEALTVANGTAVSEFHGGNIRNRGGTVVLDRVRVTGGRASSGGGIANRNGALTIIASLIDNNQAPVGGGDGGGVLNFGGDGGSAASLTVQNSTIALNSARLAGGLISYGNAQDAVTLEGVTIARNSGGDRGTGGIHLDAGQGTISARSTIVADNTAQGLPSNCGGGSPLVSLGWNVESGSDCAFSQAVDRRNADPLLPAQLADIGGPTDVLAPATLSPAVNINGNATTCGGTDQRGVARPRGPSCDAGAVEIDYPVRIDSGPPALTAGTTAVFGFSSTSTGAVTFECALDAGAFAACPGAEQTATYTNLASGEHAFRVRATVDSKPIGEATRTFVVDAVAPSLTITAGPPELTRETNAVFQFNSSDAAARFECTHVFPDGERSTITCESGWNPYDFVDGVHRFEIAAIDPAGNVTRESRTVTVDTIAPEPVTPEASGATFTFASTEPGTSFECRLEGVNDFAPCTSPASFSLAPGEYTFALRTVDAVGNRSAAITRAFTVAAPQPTATPEPQPVATPRPTPVPTPQAGETVVARAISGRILVKRPNSSEFAELRGSDGIPVGSEVNAKNGRVRLTIEPGNGRPLQQAVFYAGIFRISQPGATLDLTLSEPLAACKQARTAQAKPKSRKLWGDGKGKFRTRGRYSAATVRGTIWLVQDSCAGTFTRVRQGVVSVRDSARGKTVLVRAGRSYLAKPRRR